ncbi:hypothetical protein F4680DRAFT_417287 [Xylaria scruposa]|nr:hypothetical protein F4680DRAFT_417287 [Xylaria scruposa]
MNNPALIRAFALMLVRASIRGSKSGRSHWASQSTPTSNCSFRLTQPGDTKISGIWSIRIAWPTYRLPANNINDGFM